MTGPSIVRRQPHGRRALGFQLEVPSGVSIAEGEIFTCRELRQDGRVLGELSIEVFAAALVIDRDGVLAERACRGLAAETEVPGGPHAVAVTLPGASGFRADAARRAPLPYVLVFALAPGDLVVDGGVLVSVRSEAPDWPAAEHILRTLRIVNRNGQLAAGADSDEYPILPIVKPTPD